MPRRSGTTTVNSLAIAFASGAHMSPVSPKPCSITTAGPLPPWRTWIVAPSVWISAVRKSAGKGMRAAIAGNGTASRRATPRTNRVAMRRAA